MPTFYKEYELTNDARALEIVKAAAKGLLSRYNPVVGCTRSWDASDNKLNLYLEKDMDKHFRTIHSTTSGTT